MGKKIDFFVLTAVIAAVIFLYFRSAFQNTLPALVLALLCCMLIRHTLRRIVRCIGDSSFMKKHRLRKNMSGAMMHLACMDEAEAVQKLASLIERIYGHAHDIELIQLHPSSVLEPDDVFPLWKKNRNKDALVICATADASAACRAMASELKKPKLALIDGSGLSQLIAEDPEGFFPEEEKQVRRKLKIRRLGDLFINRKNAPRCLAMFFSMLMIYIFSANWFYLAGALFLLFVALISLRRHNRPAKLF